MEDHFHGIVGQRYKLHWRKGDDPNDPEGKNPNRFFLSGVYAGTDTFTNPYDGVTVLIHIFNECTYPDPGYAGPPTRRLNDFTFANRILIPVKEVAAGGRRKRTRRQQRRNKRRSTRGGRRA